PPHERRPWRGRYSAPLMSRARGAHGRTAAGPARASGGRPRGAAWPGWLPAALVALHAALLLWVSARASGTFDESVHLPAGVRILARCDFLTSYAQPPLAKTLSGAVALLAGAKVPSDANAGPGAERFAGYAFMRDNSARFQFLYAVGRLPTMLQPLALPWLAPRP